MQSLSLGQHNADGIGFAVETPTEIIFPDVDSSFDEAGIEVDNSNGLKIVLKSLAEDPSDYSANLQILLLAENNSGKTLTIKDTYDSLSVNGFMTDYSYYTPELINGVFAVMEIKLWESSPADNQSAWVSDIREIEFGLEIRTGYTTLNQPTPALMYEESDWNWTALKMPFGGGFQEVVFPAFSASFSPCSMAKESHIFRSLIAQSLRRYIKE